MENGGVPYGWKCPAIAHKCPYSDETSLSATVVAKVRKKALSALYRALLLNASGLCPTAKPKITGFCAFLPLLSFCPWSRIGAFPLPACSGLALLCLCPWQGRCGWLYLPLITLRRFRFPLPWVQSATALFRGFLFPTARIGRGCGGRRKPPTGEQAMSEANSFSSCGA